MQIQATKGSISNFLSKHPDHEPFLRHVRMNGSIFRIENAPKSIEDLKVLIPVLRANGTTNFSEIVYENDPDNGFAGTACNSNINNDRDLLRPFISMYMIGTRCDIDNFGPAILRIYSVSDYENTLEFNNDDFKFNFELPGDPTLQLPLPLPSFSPSDSQIPYFLAV